MPLRRALSLVLLTALTASTAGCADDATPSAATATSERRTTTTATTTPPTTAPPTTTTTVALPPAVPVDWRPCGGGFDCARVTVPVDYAQPQGPTLDVALIRRPAGDPQQRIGTLIVNPGGPGASGVRRVRRGFTLSAEVAARFDIVGFDPRGIGDSAPMRCGTTVATFRDHDLAPDTPAEATELARAARAVADECAATEGARLGHLGTREVIHDVEVIRRALGEAQVSFVGLSYGTLIGLLWAEAYPASVRALVLDGVVDPGARGDLSAQAQVEAIDATMAAVDEACAADSACPVTPAGGVLAAYDELARRVEAGQGAPAGVGPTQLAYAAFSATYDVERWPLLWTALANGLAGDFADVVEMARWFTALVPYAPFALVSCLDAPHPVGFDDWQEGAAPAADASPRFGTTAANELLPCAFWPDATYQPHVVEAPGAPPTLVIGSTGDAATPIEEAEQVARNLRRGVLLIVQLEGHIAIGDSPCATEAATRYLVDLVTPPPGTRC